jgi:DNA-directed RNA polymerase subunit F
MKSSEIISSTKKCEHCGNWTNGELAFCSHCGEILDKVYREERAELEREQSEQSPMMRKFTLVKAKDSRFWSLVEKLVQSGQMVLVALIALITIFLAVLPG